MKPSFSSRKSHGISLPFNHNFHSMPQYAPFPSLLTSSRMPVLRTMPQHSTPLFPGNKQKTKATHPQTSLFSTIHPPSHHKKLQNHPAQKPHKRILPTGVSQCPIRSLHTALPSNSEPANPRSPHEYGVPSIPLQTRTWSHTCRCMMSRTSAVVLGHRCEELCVTPLPPSFVRCVEGGEGGGRVKEEVARWCRGR